MRRLLLAAGLLWMGGLAGAQAPVERVPVPPPVIEPGDASPIGVFGHQPPGAAEALAALTSQPATHTAFTLDRDMLSGILGDRAAAANLEAVTVVNYRYKEPAFYVPEAMHGLVAAYDAAGWKHLIEQHVSRREEATPEKPVTDLWLHFTGADIDHVAVLIRGRKNMSLVEVSGALKPLDLLHLAGRFGIPKVDPGAVMVPAPPGR
jgi:hypothetical protein